MSGLSKVQYWLHPQGEPLPEDDPHFAKAPWKDADVLPPPESGWGGGLPDGKLPPIPSQIDSKTGKPYTWPMRDTIVHWAALLRDLSPGEYDLRCRTVDARGIAQPMPRPYNKSGHTRAGRLDQASHRHGRIEPGRRRTAVDVRVQRNRPATRV